MQFRKAQPEHVEAFERLAAGVEAVERRKMFGYPSAFVNGNMAFGLYADRIMVRLPDEERERLLAEGWQPSEVMPGRVMREYLTLPADVAADADTARGWLQRAADHTRSLPPKAAKRGTKRS
jgi:TfoX/Sxy family transcriptional regulator of competence genes